MFRPLAYFIVIVLFTAVSSNAQIGLLPLTRNTTITTYKAAHPTYQWGQKNKLNKWGQKDTLELPFFDDFTSTTIYPDSSKWRDNFVFVNTDFPIKPPSYGVATFDFFNEEGFPYSPLELAGTVGADTLTSQAINLSDSSGSAYSISDSFYFSFYYQGRGLGDLITEEDSLKLEFLSASGSWVKAWSKAGDEVVDFRQVLIPILNPSFLHEAFQFRFSNITHRWGNNNHWHIDYIYLNQKRSLSDVFYDDYAIQSRPTSLLTSYFSMPYDHFMVDPSLASDSIFFDVSNRNQIVINAEVKHQEEHVGNVLVNTSFSNNAANVPGTGSARRKVKGYDFTGLTGIPLVIDREYLVRESGRINPVLFQGNDHIKVKQIFERHYAYDDGTAESGFGFNDLRGGEGQVAISFDLKKSDTIRAVAIHITHNINDLSKQRFTLHIWNDIEFGGGADDIIYSEIISVDDLHNIPVINGFTILPLKEPILLPSGKFYIGWSQDREYNLGVGFDKNNGYIRAGRVMNKNIYFNVGNGWLQNSNKQLAGAPMIRPVLGAETPWGVGVNDIVATESKPYPNPTTGIVHLPFGAQNIKVFDLKGQIMNIQNDANSPLNINQLSNGIYILQYSNEEGNNRSFRLIKTNK